MDQPPHTRGQHRPAHILGTDDVNVVTIAQWTPAAHHGGEVEDGIDIPDRRKERPGISNVPAKDPNIALDQPGGVLFWENKYPHPAAAILQSRDQVVAE
jgi:hypothetical protein